MSGLSDALLWRKIDAYDLDCAALPFSTKLAWENGWPPGYTRRVIDQYKRFIYAICVSDRLLSPSPDVDKAWHLHLTYTRDYWQRFCKETLGREVHHDPSQGGEHERAKFRQAYVDTIQVLMDEFGEEPPSEVWPLAGSTSRIERKVIDPARYYVLPKPMTEFFVTLTATVAITAVAYANEFVGPLGAIIIFGIGAIASFGFLPKARDRRKANGNSGGGCGGGSDGDGGGCGGGD
jgi:hypothetical protein